MLPLLIASRDVAPVELLCQLIILSSHVYAHFLEHIVLITHTSLSHLLMKAIVHGTRELIHWLTILQPWSDLKTVIHVIQPCIVVDDGLAIQGCPHELQTQRNAVASRQSIHISAQRCKHIRTGVLWIRTVHLAHYTGTTLHELKPV